MKATKEGLALLRELEQSLFRASQAADDAAADPNLAQASGVREVRYTVTELFFAIRDFRKGVASVLQELEQDPKYGLREEAERIALETAVEAPDGRPTVRWYAARLSGAFKCTACGVVFEGGQTSIRSTSGDALCMGCGSRRHSSSTLPVEGGRS